MAANNEFGDGLLGFAWNRLTLESRLGITQTKSPTEVQQPELPAAGPAVVQQSPGGANVDDGKRKSARRKEYAAVFVSI